ncbi:hypothetical protein ACSBR2_000406 [Camellia fascicularis]
MQSSFLPKKTIKTIDKLNMDFLWGSTMETWKIHAVNWENVSKPKKLGRLGIKQTFLVNLVCMANLNWRLENDKEFFWAKILKAKYHDNSNSVG